MDKQLLQEKSRQIKDIIGNAAVKKAQAKKYVEEENVI